MTLSDLMEGLRRAVKADTKIASITLTQAEIGPILAEYDKLTEPANEQRNLTMHKGTPKWRHDCDRCRFLGQTIGGGRLTDLYVCDTRGPDSSPSVIARFSDDGPDYYSIDANYAHANGHSELFAAAYLWRREENQ
jgi:hypothetical protein